MAYICKHGFAYPCDKCHQEEKEQLRKRITHLRALLKDAVKTIKAWHGIHAGDVVWDMYYENGPEMKPIREELQKTQIK